MLQELFYQRWQRISNRGKKGLNQVHINQRVIWRTHTHTYTGVHKALIFKENLWGFSGLDSTFTNRETAHVHTNVDTFVYFFSVLGFHQHKVDVFPPQKIELLQTILQSQYFYTWQSDNGKLKSDFWKHYCTVWLHLNHCFNSKVQFSGCFATGTGEKMK